jgi:RNA polymerase sigma-70 factor (ECF subfamily)
MAEQEDTKTWFSRGVGENLDALYGVALRLTRNRADAEDLVAESVARAWSAIDTLADRNRFRPWLFRILHNRFVSDYRKKIVRPLECLYEEQFGDEEAEDIASYLLQQPDDFLNWWANPELECSGLRCC